MAATATERSRAHRSRVMADPAKAAEYRAREATRQRRLRRQQKADYARLLKLPKSKLELTVELAEEWRAGGKKDARIRELEGQLRVYATGYISHHELSELMGGGFISIEEMRSRMRVYLTKNPIKSCRHCFKLT